MLIRIAAIGRLRDPPMQALIERFRSRCHWSLEIVELQPKGKQTEAALLGRSADEAERLVAMDERGRNLSSRNFADRLSAWQDQSCRQVTFLLGGADGLDPELRSRANLVMAFGEATWPHMLARVMLCEQLYRASSILQNHPYHREG